ncbi:MAG: DUF697 domain-containing protein [Kiritimatiellae bacterium]|nr:DUF697 domain-containing protein [Kiritimatiellia bacterium]
MFRNLWRTVRTAVWVIGILLSFFAVVELIRAYQVLRALHWAAGTAYLFVLFVAVAWCVAYYVVSVVRRPAVLIPPQRPLEPSAALGEFRAYGRYLHKLLTRLSVNEQLPEEQRRALRDEAVELRRALAVRPGDKAELDAAFRRLETEAVQPAMDVLDGLAEKEVRSSVRDVMIAVSLSPWRSVDLLVVLYRNLGMVQRLIAVYNNRPRLKEQVAILRDVLSVVATVNFLNLGTKLLENLCASVPGLGRIAGEVAQGTGAGMFTSVAGHAAIDRCRAFRGWDERTAVATIGEKLHTFWADLKGIAAEDLLPHFGEITARMKEGVQAAFEKTGDVLDSFVRRPVVSAGRGVADTGTVMWRAVRRAGGYTWDKAVVGARATGRFVGAAAVYGGRGLWRGTVGGARLLARGAGAAVKGAKAGTRKLREHAAARKSQTPPPAETQPAPAEKPGQHDAS